MPKPVLVALISFVGLCGTSLLISYFKHDTIDWSRGIVDGLSLTFCMYFVAYWTENREPKQQQESSNSPYSQDEIPSETSP